MSDSSMRNTLTISRLTRGLSRKAVARLIDDLAPSTVGKYETGQRMPSLVTALALEIIYRKPVAFLWPDLYEELRARIRGMEEKGEGAEDGGQIRA